MINLKKKKLVILDHNFKDYQGHHFNYNKYLQDTLKDKYDLEFYFKKNISKKILKRFESKVFKFFEQDEIITRYASKNLLFKIKKVLKKIHIIKKLYYFLIQKMGITMFILLKKVYKKSKFIEKITEVDSKYQQTDFFIHSLSTDEFFDFINSESLFKKNQNNYWIVYRRDPRELKNYINYIAVIFKNKRLNLLTDSHRIKNFLNNKGVSVKHIDIPIFFESKKKFNKNKNKNKNKIIVTYLGDARKEKGFFKLPEIIKNTNEKFYFNIQAFSNGYDKSDYNQTIKELKNNNNLKLIFGQLNESEYSNLLFNSDIILIPYLEDDYKYRTSSIFFEAIMSNKISIVTKGTWMAKFYENNKFLEFLILTPENSLNKILDYVFFNKKKIIHEIDNLKKTIQLRKSQKKFINVFNLNLVKKNNLRKLSFNYLIDENTINRKNDGNQYASSFFLKNILSQLDQYDLERNVNIFYNYFNLNLKFQLSVKNNFYKKFNSKYFKFVILEGLRNFILNKGKLSFHSYHDISKIDISDIILVNFHYYFDLIKKISIFGRKKILVIVHDRYEVINKSKDILLDKENLYYFFVSYAEYTEVKLNYAKKYLVFPSIFLKKKISPPKKNYNYYFVSSGSDVDIQNLKIFLSKKKFKEKLNLVGEICSSKDLLDNKSNNINFLGFVDDLKKLYLNPSSVFIIPRYVGSGIPIKFLECLKYNSKCLLFGDSDLFGVTPELISSIIVKKYNEGFDKIVNSINYTKNYKTINSHINNTNLSSLKRFKKEIKNHDYI